MRDSTKVIIGFGCVWGVYAFGDLFIEFLSLGNNRNLPETAVMVLYGVTILPVCLLAIWYPRIAGWALLVLSMITAFAFWYREFHMTMPNQNENVVFERQMSEAANVAIPAILGFFLLRSVRRSHE